MQSYKHAGNKAQVKQASNELTREKKKKKSSGQEKTSKVERRPTRNMQLSFWQFWFMLTSTGCEEPKLAAVKESSPIMI